jgi:hypothetical protein
MEWNAARHVPGLGVRPVPVPVPPLVEGVVVRLGVRFWVPVPGKQPTDCGHASQPKQKLLPTMRANLRLRHFMSRTEEAYVGWVRRFVKFHRLEHPDRMGEAEATAFLTHLGRRSGCRSC